MQLTYVGPHDAVEIDLPIDAYPKTEVVTVVRGESHEFSKEDAKRLLEQPSNWQQVGSKSKSKSKAKPAAATEATAPPEPETPAETTSPAEDAGEKE